MTVTPPVDAQPGEPAGAAVNICADCGAEAHPETPHYFDTPPVDAQPVEPLTVEEEADFRQHPTTYRERRLLATLDAARAGDGLLRAWMENVVTAWTEHWQGRDHRYGRDFAAFVGERLLTDYNFRDLERAALHATATEGQLPPGVRWVRAE